MNFLDLYRFASAQAGPAIPVRALAEEIKMRHAEIGEVFFWPVALDPQISLGHLKLERDRDSPYSEPFTVANIRFHSGLNRCWRRFVCCKELMHLFDSDDAKTDSRRKLEVLFSELEDARLTTDSSPMFKSERNANWMALAVLCPQASRDACLKLSRDGMSNYEIALRLKVPEGCIPPLIGRYYESVLQKLTEY